MFSDLNFLFSIGKWKKKYLLQKLLNTATRITKLIIKLNISVGNPQLYYVLVINFKPLVDFRASVNVYQNY